MPADAPDIPDIPDIPGLVAAAAQAGRGLTALDPRSCAVALGLDSLTICLLDHAGLELVRYDPADTAGVAFEDLQYTLGEGPTVGAARTGEPVLVPTWTPCPNADGPPCRPPPTGNPHKPLTPFP
ncbi:hypothetical protein ACIBL8_15680 [Streptomyces sp. NPDC050523]|uniref:hypothetical protein n=1 Tax=Streptomyces sp. NPDC050523 TaxID=3365622 RepID=UPI003797099F